METQKYLKNISRFLALTLFSLTYFLADPVFALSAEYKCTTSCSLCINFDKKTICSEKYADDSIAFEKGKKLSRLVNDGLIIPTSDIRPGFLLDAFSKKFFNCELMVKKAEQIKQATDNMCVKSTAKQDEKVSFRVPASVRKEVVQHNVGSSKEAASKVTSKSEVKKSESSKKVDGNVNVKKAAPSSEMDDLIKQME